jgi:hypothetical protein
VVPMGGLKLAQAAAEANEMEQMTYRVQSTRLDQYQSSSRHCSLRRSIACTFSQYKHYFPELLYHLLACSWGSGN